MPLISLCIPTYNREMHLGRCLNSIIENKNINFVDVEICISDNNSTDGTSDLITKVCSLLKLNYNKNHRNIGMAANFLKVVDMATGDFIWILGDDDFLLPNALERVIQIIKLNQEVDFIYANSVIVPVELINDPSKKFSPATLPKKLKKFSNYKNDGVIPFFNLIDPKISFDYLGGVFLSIFRREKWIEHKKIIKDSYLDDQRIFSNLHNTFPHIVIFSAAFTKSKAYFCSEPVSGNISGVREWAPMWPLIKSIRLVEAVDQYRSTGLPLLQYIYCKNSALNTYIPDILIMHLKGRLTGVHYIDLRKSLLGAIFYPNFYYSFFRPVLRKYFWIFLFNKLINIYKN
jgi:glycosyltransferase involved in cell wall biosynthesis